MSLVLGVDFGTASVRSIVVDPHTGSILGSGEYAYQHTPSIPTPSWSAITWRITASVLNNRSRTQ